MVLALLFTPSTFFHLVKTVSKYDLVPPSIGIKPNFILLRSEGMFIFCSKYWFFSLTPWVFNFVIFCWLVYFLTCLWEASQNSLLLFSLCRDTLDIYFETPARPAWDWFSFLSCGRGLKILSYLYWMFYCPSAVASYLFNCPMTLRSYSTADFGLILFKIFFLPTEWSNCWRQFERMIESLGSPCVPPISAVATTYDSLYLRR